MNDKNKTVIYVRILPETRKVLDVMARESNLPLGKVAGDLLAYGARKLEAGEINLNDTCVTESSN